MITTIGVGAQSTLGAQHFCPKNMYEKNNKMPEFYMIIAQKINKISEFYKISPEKFPNVT